MRKIKKKTWPSLFEEVMRGNKKFDLRLADFKLKKGDVLILCEWDPESQKYTGREIEKKVKFVIKTKGQKFWSDEDVEKHGYQIIGFD